MERISLSRILHWHAISLPDFRTIKGLALSGLIIIWLWDSRFSIAIPGDQNLSSQALTDITSVPPKKEPNAIMITNTASANGHSHANDKFQEWKLLATKAKFKPQQMAALQHISLRHLERLFHAQFGMTPTEWIREFRCRLVLEMIANGYSNKWIAFELNFGSQSHLCHEFKKVYRLPPRHYFRSIGHVPKF